MKFTIERLIIVALLIAVAVFAIRGCISKTVQNVEYKDVIVQRTDSLQHWKDEAGREHAQRILADADKASVMFSFRKEVDSLKSTLGIKEQQIETFSLIGTKTSGKINLKVDTLGDTAKYYQFSYKDRWLDISGSVGFQNQLEYSIDDSLVITTYWKRKWFLGKKTFYLDGYSLNPNSHIHGLESTKIKTSQPGRFGIGPYVGFGYNGVSWKPSVGISLQYSLIRF